MKRLLMMIGVAAAIVAMADVALATDLDSYRFRYDFSSGTKKFYGSKERSKDPLTDTGIASGSRSDMTVLAVSGPDGDNSAVHPLNDAWSAMDNGSPYRLFDDLNANWTLAMSVRPGTTENGVLFSLGRKNSKERKNISICASTNTTWLIVDENQNNGTQNLKSRIFLDQSVDVSKGFHTVVVVYKKPASGNAGTLDFYVDGVFQKQHTTVNYEFGGAFQFCKTCSGLMSGEKDTMDDLNVAFRDVRFYPSAFTREDAKKYAAMYPAGSLRANASVRSYGVNAIDTGYLTKKDSSIAVDFQYVEVAKANRLFGAYGTSGTLGCSWYIQGNSEFAHIFNDGYDYEQSTLNSKKANTRRAYAVLDRPSGKTSLWQDGTPTTDVQTGSATVDADVTLPLFAEFNNSATQNFSKAAIYSICMKEGGALKHFFAPHLDATHGAGFMDVITGEFKGESMASPKPALSYTDGFGSAADYKYENDKLCVKVYADAVGAGGSVAASSGGEALSPQSDGGFWVEYGATLVLAATPADGYSFEGWAGDVRAIESDAASADEIAVTVDKALQFEARFTPIERFHAADGGYAASGERSAATAVDPNDVDLVIAGNAYGFEGVEAAGSYMVNGSHSFSATNATSGVFGGTAIGYRLERWNRDTKAWVFVSYGGGNTFAYTNCVANGRMRLTWFWQQTGQVRKYGVGDYIQYDSDYPSTLLAHFDGILNAGAEHAATPGEWVNLVAGGFDLATNKAPAFSSDAWVADKASYFTSASDAVKNALFAKSFTLEMMISNPGGQAKDSYEYWAYFGNDASHRQLVVDLREKNSKNPLVQGVQYRESDWKDRTVVAKGDTTKWDTRQYIAVVCDEDGATTYCDGANQIHSNTGGTLSKFQTGIYIGAAYDGTWPLYAGSEICAIRMTAGALEPWQLEYNNAIDQVRFNGNVTIVNGAVGDTENVGESSATDGVYDVASGTWTITAEPVKVGDKTYHPRLTVETLTGGEWVQKEKRWTDSYTVDKAKLDSSRIRLTWTWAIRPGLLISFH